MIAYSNTSVPTTLGYIGEHDPSWSPNGNSRLQQRRRSSLVTMFKSMVNSTNGPANVSHRQRSVETGIVSQISTSPTDVNLAPSPMTTSKHTSPITRVQEVKPRPIALQDKNEEALNSVLGSPPARSKHGDSRPPPSPRHNMSVPPSTHHHHHRYYSGSLYDKNDRKDSEELCLEKKYGRATTSLGFGSNAEVSIVRAGKGKVYAVKRFRRQKENESDREYQKRMYSEFCISSTMIHENIIETIDLIRDENNRFCIVMEYCDGGDFFSYLNNYVGRSLCPAETLCYLKQLINGVAYMHSIGVAHRDIKPENILLCQSGHILKICDFGVADVFRTPHTSRLRESRGMCGSEPYIPPEELARPEREYDATKADMWAVGVVFYVMLYGGMPWHRAHRDDSKFHQYLRKVDPELTQDATYYPFEVQKDIGVRSALYGLLHPIPSSRISAASIQNSTWFRNISCCHVHDFSTQHQHGIINTPPKN